MKGCWMLQVRLMHDHGYVLGNLDATIILQRPKLSPHKETIRANLCKLLDADPSVINVKVGKCVCSGPCMHAHTACKHLGCCAQAKTHEKVDSLGENRSIAVHAVCMLIRKDLMSL